MASGATGPSDDDLVAAARAGDERAFGGLVARHETAVLRVLRLLGVPSSEREDLAQDVFLRAFRYLASYAAGRSFAGWLYRITVNVAHDWRRARASRQVDGIAWSVEAGAAIDPGPRPDERSERAALRKRLEDALGTLTERERAVFVLCEIESLSTIEVARALGITRITVRRHLGLARGHLKRILRETESEESVDVVDRSSVRIGSN